jgi:hypothetical protein
MLINSWEELEKWKRAKGPLLVVARLSKEDRPPAYRDKWIRYRREAKAAVLYVGGRRISWRRPPTLASLWGAAWDAGWRSGWIAGHRTACKMAGLPSMEVEIPKPPKEEGKL